MQRRSVYPFCGLALEGRLALVIQLPEIRRAFRHEFVAPQRIHVAIAYSTPIALPRRHVLSVLIGLRGNQKACPGSLLVAAKAWCWTRLHANADMNRPRANSFNNRSGRCRRVAIRITNRANF